MTDRLPVFATELGIPAFAAALPTLLHIYTTAMGYHPETGRARAPLWAQHAQRAGFRCVVAAPTVAGIVGDRSTPLLQSRDHDGHDAARGHTPTNLPGPILGFSYGYLGAPGQWWHNEVARGLGGTGSPWLVDYFELTELHVAPHAQGSGIGEMLLRALLTSVRAKRVLLSTPEGNNRAWRLYRRLGFTDVLREFRFTGDGRTFGVLGRTLPLPTTQRSTLP